MEVLAYLLVILARVLPVSLPLAGLIINIMRLCRKDNDEKKRKTAKRNILICAVLFVVISYVTIVLMSTGKQPYNHAERERRAAMTESAAASVESESIAE